MIHARLRVSLPETTHMISMHVVDEVFALLGCYAAYVGSCSPTFRDGLSRPETWVNSCPIYVLAYEIKWEKYCRVRQATDENVAHAHCMLDT